MAVNTVPLCTVWFLSPEELAAMVNLPLQSSSVSGQAEVRQEQMLPGPSHMAALGSTPNNSHESEPENGYQLVPLDLSVSRRARPPDEQVANDDAAMQPPRKRARIANKSLWVLTDVFPDVVVREIISKIPELTDRIKLRGVCRQWYWQVDSMCQCLKYVQLHLSHRTVERGPPNTIQRFLFERSWSEPQVDPIAKCACTIRAMSLNPRMLKHFVRMYFKKVHTLVLYFDLQDNRTNIGYVEGLLILLPKLDSFSFIQCHFGLRAHRVEKICSVLNERAPYKRLDLCLRPYPRGHLMHRSVTGKLRNAVQIVNTFNVSYELRDYAEIMGDIGWARRNGTDKLVPHNTPGVTSLSLQCTLSAQELSRAFGQNPELKTVRQLQLYLITSLNSAQNHLLHFKNVERLTLFYLSRESQRWSSEWVKFIDTLPRLTELVLVNFIPNIPFDMTMMEKIRKLTIGTFNFFHKIREMVIRYRPGLRPTNVFAEVIHIFARFIWRKFPQLEVLNIFSYDNIEYEENKNNFKRELRRFFPQLIVNMNLRERNLIDHL